MLLELPDADAVVTSRLTTYLLGELAAADNRRPILLHGEGRSTWPALHLARERGLDARIGLEDTLTLPDGAPAPDNASLVAAALS